MMISHVVAPVKKADELALSVQPGFVLVCGRRSRLNIPIFHPPTRTKTRPKKTKTKTINQKQTKNKQTNRCGDERTLPTLKLWCRSQHLAGAIACTYPGSECLARKGVPFGEQNLVVE
jgi:hypothetical protein